MSATAILHYLKVLLYHEKVNTSYGTNLMALAAADALIVIHLSTEVFNRYRLGRTGLHTLHTADAACLTLLSCLRTLVVVFAKHRSLFGIKREKLNKTSGAGFDAHLTGTALVRVNAGNTVADEYGIIRADLYTVTKAYTAVNTVLGAAKKLSCNFAGAYAAVFKLFFNIMAVTLTHNSCNGRNYLPCRKAHYLSNFLCRTVTAGDTEVALLGFTLCKGIGIAVTACVAAGAAIGTGETGTDLFGFFVNGNCKNGRSDCKAEAGNKAYSRYNEYGN